MPAHQCPNPFDSVVEMQNFTNRTLPEPRCWRLVAEPGVGEINALPEIYGIACATNGIHVALFTSSDILFGHVASFVPLQAEGEQGEREDKLTLAEQMFGDFVA